MKRLLIFPLLISAVWGADLPSEYPTIRRAAYRNGCYGDNLTLLLAIRQAENGRPGREFGIMNPKASNLDKQAGWCAATIMNQHKRSGIKEVNQAFLENLQKRYCPIGDTRDTGNLNSHWLKNVTFWYKKLKKETI